MVQSVSFALAFLAGVVSFLSPCVLPLIPGYISFISGSSLTELKENSQAVKLKVLRSSFFFVLGFALIFIGLGASASLIGSFLASYRAILTKVAGVVVIVFGLSLIGSFNLNFFRGRQLGKGFSRSPLGTVLLGVAFSFAWTPCIGPVLTSILAFAGSSQTVTSGAVLLAFYALGLGLPFILTGLLFNRFLQLFSWLKNRYQLVTTASGVILVIMGLLLLTNQLTYFNSWLKATAVKVGWPTL